MKPPRVPQMETCSWCRGYGLRMNGEDVVDCAACGGGGVVEARDERGRFLPWIEPKGMTLDAYRAVR